MLVSDLRARGTSQTTEPSRRIPDLDKDPFSECMRCGFELCGVTSMPESIKHLSIVLNCGHVLCNTCVQINDSTHLNVGRPSHCQHDFKCSLCGLLSPALTIPTCVRICRRRFKSERNRSNNTDEPCTCEICEKGIPESIDKKLNNIAYCGVHLEEPTIVFCRACGKHVCEACVNQNPEEYTDTGHEIVPTSRVNLHLEDSMHNAADLYVKLDTLNREANVTLDMFMERTRNLKNNMGCNFIAIINAAIGRFCQLYGAIREEEDKMKDIFRRISDNTQHAQRRIVIGKEMNDLSRSKDLMPEDFVSDSYKMSAQKIFGDAADLHQKIYADTRKMAFARLQYFSKMETEEVLDVICNMFSDYSSTVSGQKQFYHLDSFVKLMSPSGAGIIERPQTSENEQFHTDQSAEKKNIDGFSRFKTALEACVLNQETPMHPSLKPRIANQSELDRLLPGLVSQIGRERAVQALSKKQNASKHSNSSSSSHPHSTASVSSADHSPVPGSSSSANSAAIALAKSSAKAAIEEADRASKQEALLGLIRAAATDEKVIKEEPLDEEEGPHPAMVLMQPPDYKQHETEESQNSSNNASSNPSSSAQHSHSRRKSTKQPFHIVTYDLEKEQGPSSSASTSTQPSSSNQDNPESEDLMRHLMEVLHKKKQDERETEERIQQQLRLQKASEALRTLQMQQKPSGMSTAQHQQMMMNRSKTLTQMREQLALQQQRSKKFLPPQRAQPTREQLAQFAAQRALTSQHFSPLPPLLEAALKDPKKICQLSKSDRGMLMNQAQVVGQLNQYKNFHNGMAQTKEAEMEARAILEARERMQQMLKVNPNRGSLDRPILLSDSPPPHDQNPITAGPSRRPGLPLSEAPHRNAGRLAPQDGRGQMIPNVRPQGPPYGFSSREQMEVEMRRRQEAVRKMEAAAGGRMVIPEGISKGQLLQMASTVREQQQKRIGGMPSNGSNGMMPSASNGTPNMKMTLKPVSHSTTMRNFQPSHLQVPQSSHHMPHQPHQHPIKTAYAPLPMRDDGPGFPVRGPDSTRLEYPTNFQLNIGGRKSSANEVATTAGSSSSAVTSASEVNLRDSEMQRPQSVPPVMKEIKKEEICSPEKTRVRDMAKSKSSGVQPISSSANFSSSSQNVSIPEEQKPIISMPLIANSSRTPSIPKSSSITNSTALSACPIPFVPVASVQPNSTTIISKEQPKNLQLESGLKEPKPEESSSLEIVIAPTSSVPKQLHRTVDLTNGHDMNQIGRLQKPPVPAQNADDSSTAYSIPCVTRIPPIPPPLPLRSPQMQHQVQPEPTAPIQQTRPEAAFVSEPVPEDPKSTETSERTAEQIRLDNSAIKDGPNGRLILRLPRPSASQSSDERESPEKQMTPSRSAVHESERSKASLSTIRQPPPLPHKTVLSDATTTTAHTALRPTTTEMPTVRTHEMFSTSAPIGSMCRGPTFSPGLIAASTVPVTSKKPETGMMPTVDECRMNVSGQRDDDAQSDRTLDSDGTHRWCFVCNDNIQLTDTEKGICDTCPRVFHRECAFPKVHGDWSTQEDWQCILCKPIPPPGPGDNVMLMTDRNRQICQHILMRCFLSKSATKLVRSIDKSMVDLETIAQRLEKGSKNELTCPMEFMAMMNDMLQHISANYQKDSEMEQCARKVWVLFRSSVKKLLPHHHTDVWLYISLYNGPQKKKLAPKRPPSTTPSKSPIVPVKKKR